MSDLIVEDRDTVTRRAQRGDRPVWIRSPRAPVQTLTQAGGHPQAPGASADVAARLRYGAATAQALDLPGVARVLAVEEGEGGPAVILEDFGGRTLRSVLADERKLEITEAVRIATQVARTLGALHGRRVVHKGVEPSTILLNSETGEVKLTGFDGSSRLDREEPALAGPGRAGPLGYMAPEQTGRMNRVVDYRADLYALGVTLYEMLTGHLPFPRRASGGAGRGARLPARSTSAAAPRSPARSPQVSARRPQAPRHPRRGPLPERRGSDLRPQRVPGPPDRGRDARRLPARKERSHHELPAAAAALRPRGRAGGAAHRLHPGDEGRGRAPRGVRPLRRRQDRADQRAPRPLRAGARLLLRRERQSRARRALRRPEPGARRALRRDPRRGRGFASQRCAAASSMQLAPASPSSSR